MIPVLHARACANHTSRRAPRGPTSRASRDHRRPRDPRRGRRRRPRSRNVPPSAGYHADAAAAAARAQEGRGPGPRAAHAELNGRAHLRRPCVLSLCHSSGAELVAPLEPGDDPSPRRAQLQAMLDRPEATLVAHRAQIEVECLLNHGVAVDVECTQLAAKACSRSPSTQARAPPVDSPRRARRAGVRAGSRQSPRDRDWRLTESLDEEGASIAGKTRATPSSYGSCTSGACVTRGCSTATG